MALFLGQTSLLASRCCTPVSVTSFILHAPYSTEKANTKRVPSSPSSMKRGTGGRSSFNGMVATVFGASGLLGRYVCNKLGKTGTQLILPYRCDAYDMRRLRLVGDLGQVLFQPFHLKDEDSIRKAVQHSNVVINLIGRDYETRNFSFDDVHVKGAHTLAKISKEMGVETFVHLSSLNATEYPEEFLIKGGSKFLSSKWHGELAVLNAFPEAVIIRPADIYGQEDRFLRYYCGSLRRQLKWMPMYKRGDTSEKQPVYVEDVASGILAACKDRDARGKTFQFVGPKRYLIGDLVDWFYRIMRKSDDWGYFRYDMAFDPIFQLRLSLATYTSLATPLGNVHWEKVEREAHSDKIVRGVPTLRDLGIKLTHMEDQVPWELKSYKAWSYYDAELGEFESPTPPPPIVSA